MKKRILICDDDGDICDATAIVLEKGGYEVCIIKNGRNIKEKIKEFNPDLLLLDVMMRPEEDGREIAKRLKQDKDTSKLPVLLFTAMNSPEKLTTFAGADGYIAKPYDMHKLLRTVKTAIKKNQSVNLKA